MTLQGTARGSRRFPKWTATADHTSGQIVQTPGGRVGIIQGLNSAELKTGQEVSADTEAIIDAASASGTTFSAGGTVGWDDTAKLAVTGGTGDFDIGKAEAAKTAGQLTVRVALNA